MSTPTWNCLIDASTIGGQSDPFEVTAPVLVKATGLGAGRVELYFLSVREEEIPDNRKSCVAYPQVQVVASDAKQVPCWVLCDAFWLGSITIRGWYRFQLAGLTTGNVTSVCAREATAEEIAAVPACGKCT